jgi:hypothetical protein
VPAVAVGQDDGDAGLRVEYLDGDAVEAVQECGDRVVQCGELGLPALGVRVGRGAA